jgi:hypothetical protein
MLSIGARMLQLHFGARDDGPGDPWFWIIGSGELDFKSLINLSDVNNDYRLSIKKSIDEDNKKIWFRESVNPIQVDIGDFIFNSPLDEIKYFKIVVDKIDFSSLRDDYNFFHDIHTLKINNNQAAFILSSLVGQNSCKIHSLSLNDTNFEQRFMRGIIGVYTLNLHKNQHVDNVSALGSVHTLTLDDVWRVTDVSALSCVHTLKLEDLDQVANVNSLGTVYNLTLDWLDTLSDVSKLGSVHTLTLKRLENVTDVSALGSVHTLTLTFLSGVTDVSALGGVHTLKINNLSDVTDVSALGGVHTLKLNNLSAGWAYNLSMLQ